MTELERRVLLARAAGEDAAAATRQLALRNRDPDERGGLTRFLSSTPPVTADQIASANRTISSFVAAVDDVNGLLAPDRSIGSLDDIDLAGSHQDVAALHNRINATLAALERLRIDIILGR